MAKLEPGDYCFAKDRAILLGSTRPLKTVLSNDPWLVLKVRPTTAVVRRLADDLVTVYSLEDLKKYSRLDPQFQTFPQEVKDVLVNSFQDLDILHFKTLQKFS